MVLPDLTEHHLNCIQNLVHSAAARMGGGVNQDKPTQKNKHMWTCLAILKMEIRLLLFESFFLCVF